MSYDEWWSGPDAGAPSLPSQLFAATCTERHTSWWNGRQPDSRCQLALHGARDRDHAGSAARKRARAGARAQRDSQVRALAFSSPFVLLTRTCRRDHVTYCFAQMLRFCHLASSGVEPFRQAQFGLALGRVQELLGCVGGKAAWWCAFEPLLLATPPLFAAVAARTRAYLDLLGLPHPSEAFLNKR